MLALALAALLAPASAGPLLPPDAVAVEGGALHSTLSAVAYSGLYDINTVDLRVSGAVEGAPRLRWSASAGWGSTEHGPAWTGRDYLLRGYDKPPASHLTSLSWGAARGGAQLDGWVTKRLNPYARAEGQLLVAWGAMETSPDTQYALEGESDLGLSWGVSAGLGLEACTSPDRAWRVCPYAEQHVGLYRDVPLDFGPLTLGPSLTRAGLEVRL